MYHGLCFVYQGGDPDNLMLSLSLSLSAFLLSLSPSTIYPFHQYLTLVSLTMSLLLMSPRHDPLPDSALPPLFFRRDLSPLILCVIDSFQGAGRRNSCLY